MGRPMMREVSLTTYGPGLRKRKLQNPGPHRHFDDVSVMYSTLWAESRAHSRCDNIGHLADAEWSGPPPSV